MKPTTRSPDGLRSTPSALFGRDAEVFPAIHAVAIHLHKPTCYRVHVRKYAVWIYLDNFYLPRDIGTHLSNGYRTYVEWWLRKGNPARKHFRPVGIATPFTSWIELEVLREHAPWWIELCNQAAVFLYDPWSLESEDWQQDQTGQIQ